MGWVSKVGSFFGGNAMEVVEKGADIVERWAPSAAKKQEMAREIDEQIRAAANDARKHDAKIGAVTGPLNNAVNAINRLIRPSITIGLVGGVAGLWELPKTGDIDPVILGFTELVLIFWFGGRALFKDLPSLLTYVRSTKTKGNS